MYQCQVKGGENAREKNDKTSRREIEAVICKKVTGLKFVLRLKAKKKSGTCFSWIGLSCKMLKFKMHQNYIVKKALQTVTHAFRCFLDISVVCVNVCFSKTKTPSFLFLFCNDQCYTSTWNQKATTFDLLGSRANRRLRLHASCSWDNSGYNAHSSFCGLSSTGKVSSISEWFWVAHSNEQKCLKTGPVFAGSAGDGFRKQRGLRAAEKH